MINILYWDGVSSFNDADFSKYRSLILRLLAGDTRGADLDLKRAGQSRIYSARINDADRLLFTTVNGKMLLLEVILNHDYQKSRFLKPGVLSAFMDKHQNTMKESICPTDFEEIDESELNVDRSLNTELCLSFKAVTRYNGQFLHLSQEQFRACQTAYPMLVIGPPGSGKSLIAVELLNQASRIYSSSNQRPIACVCCSRGVRDHLRMQWQQGNIAIDGGCEVFFLTVDELFAQLLGEDALAEAKHFNEVGKTHCQAFIKTHQQHIKKLVKAKTMTTCEVFLNSDPNLIYQEFYIMAGFTQDEYLAKGQRATLFTEAGDRKAVFETFEKYKEQLTAENVIHPAFAVWPKADVMFQKIIVDEAQDLSLLQLQQLRNLTQDHQMACAMDPHQSLTVSQSLRSGLQQLLMQAPTPLSTIQLSTTHRCPKIVAKMANKVLAIKNFLFDGVTDKRELAQINLTDIDNRGSIIWQDVEPAYESISNEIEQLCQQLGLNRSQVALIVPEEDLAGIELQKDIDLIFSARSIKGLEFPAVIILAPCRQLAPLNNFLPKGINRVLAIKQSRSKGGSSPDKPMTASLNKHYSVALNSLFVSLTRASQHLIVWQENANPELTNLINQLKSVITEEESLATSEVIDIDNQPPRHQQRSDATKAQWQETCLKLYSVGNIDAAKRIYINHLQQERDDDFEKYIDVAYGRSRIAENANAAKENEIKKPAIEGVKKTKSIQPKVTLNHTNLANRDVTQNKKAEAYSKLELEGTIEQIGQVERPLSPKERKEISVFINLFSINDINLTLLERLYKSTVAMHVLFGGEFIKNEKRYSTFANFLLFDTGLSQLFYKSIMDSKNEDIKNILVRFLQQTYQMLTDDETKLQSNALDGYFRGILLLDRFENNARNRTDEIFRRCHKLHQNMWSVFLLNHKLLEWLLEDKPHLLEEPGFHESFHHPIEGASVFHALCYEVRDGGDFLVKFFNLHKHFITEERLHKGENNFSLRTPFYSLCSSELGVNLIKEHWDFFKDKITPDGLDRKIGGIARIKNRTPLLELLSSEYGLALLIEKWDFFRSVIKIDFMRTPRVISINKDGSNYISAELPLSYCLKTPTGLALIKLDSNYFLGSLTSELFLHQPKPDGRTSGPSCFYLLCRSVNGRDFVIKHWYQYFKNLIPITALKSDFAQELNQDLLLLGYGIGREHACEVSHQEKFEYANRMYLAALVHKERFFNLWEKDESNDFLFRKMANGKSAFINLNEKGYFNLINFENFGGRLLTILHKLFISTLTTLDMDTSAETIVLLYHLACCKDINSEHENATHLVMLNRHLRELNLSFIDIVMANVPSACLLTSHLFICITMLDAHGDQEVLLKFWAYYKSHLLSLEPHSHCDQFHKTIAVPGMANLLIQSYHEFSNVCSDPLHALMSSSNGNKYLKQYWLSISPWITKQKLHEIHPHFGQSAFTALCLEPLGCELLVAQWHFFKNKIEESHIEGKYACAVTAQTSQRNSKLIFLKDFLKEQGLELASENSLSKGAKRRQRKKAQTQIAKLLNLGFLYDDPSTHFLDELVIAQENSLTKKNAT